MLQCLAKHLYFHVILNMLRVRIGDDTDDIHLSGSTGFNFGTQAPTTSLFGTKPQPGGFTFGIARPSDGFGECIMKYLP